jgi:hypothetical protein
MKKTILRMSLGAFFILGCASYVLIGHQVNVWALTPNQQAVCDSIGSGADCVDTGAGGGTQVDSVISTAVTVLTAVVGVIAVIMIVVSGYKYITSAGDSSKLTSAKNTLVYAIIGLVIVALAQTITRFVLSTSTGNNKSAVTCKAPKVRDPKTNTCVNP